MHSIDVIETNFYDNVNSEERDMLKLYIIIEECHIFNEYYKYRYIIFVIV